MTPTERIEQAAATGVIVTGVVLVFGFGGGLMVADLCMQAGKRVGNRFIKAIRPHIPIGGPI